MYEQNIIFDAIENPNRLSIARVLALLVFNFGTKFLYLNLF